MLRWIILISLLLQTACDSPADKDRPDSSLIKSTEQTQGNGNAEESVFEPLIATDLLNEPTPVYSFETTAEALTVWRRARAEKPALLLISNNPHLKPVPQDLQKAAVILVNNATLENIQLATTDRNPSPLILPGMAADIALRSGWFSEVAWALPLRDPSQDLDLDKLRAQLESSRIAAEDEIASISLDERVFSGSLRGVPFRSAALPLIKNLTGPVIVHIDLSYFKPIYKNEIATPLLDIVFNTLATLKKMHLKTLAVTFSYGHVDSQMALDVRFLGEIIEYLIEDPDRLGRDIPVKWQRQRDALYLANFFKKDKVRELYLAQEKDDPNAAWVKFNLYRSAVEHKEGAKALDYLAQAVELDPAFALEYFELSNRAYEKKRPEEALRMLELAAEVNHQDPFIKLQIAQLANELGKKELALEKLNKIRNLEWSKKYYPDMPQHLTDLTLFVQSSEDPTQQKAEDKKAVE